MNPEHYVIPEALSAPSEIPAEALVYLQKDNERLLELKRRYAALDIEALRPSIWDEGHTAEQLEMAYFRGDNAFVWQKRDNNLETNYLLAAYYYQSIDKLNLLETLKEDDHFGIFTYPFQENKLLSRDLLDSVGEILFLDETLNLSQQSWNILDIGAGYGRLAHRMMEALPNLKGYYCVDAVPESTFISEYYLRFRESKAQVWCLDEIEAQLAAEQIDLAVNIHSFSECTAAAAKYWLDLLREHRVPYLLTVPNPVFEQGEVLYSKEMDKSEPDLMPTILEAGYVPIVQRPKFLEPGVQRNGVTPTWYHLFRLEQ